MKITYKSKTYIHFDNRSEYSEKVENYVIGFKDNPKHNFLPLIYDEITFERFLDIFEGDIDDHLTRKKFDGTLQLVPVKIKTRPIMYASHIDNYIFKHYGLELNRLYNTFLKKNAFDNVPTAYRTNKNGKCNIDFAAEVINFIKNNDGCYVYIGDFTGFFDNLNHKYLKKMIRSLYDDNSIPEHQYRIYKSLTEFAYVDKKDIDFYTRNKNGKYKKGYQKAFFSMKDFRKFKEDKTIVKTESGKVLKVNKNEYGIPQGTAISAIYSNIYMIKADKIINDIIYDFSGMYRRYSDDYIIVLPKIKRDKFLELKIQIENILKNSAKLTIHPDKTQVMEFTKGKLIDLENENMCSLDYLGFTFDGEKAKMREKSIYNFYRTSYELIKKGVIISKRKGHVGSDARLTYKRKLYQKYHLFGERTDIKYKYKPRPYGTFITYAYKCQRIFDQVSPNTENLMKEQIFNHEVKLEKKIREAKDKLKSF